MALGVPMVMRGEKQPKGDGWRKATLGNAAFYNAYQRIWCEDCRHELIIHAEDIMELHKVPPETPFWTLAQSLVCGKCGSKKVGIMAASWDRKRDRPDD